MKKFENIQTLLRAPTSPQTPLPEAHAYYLLFIINTIWH